MVELIDILIDQEIIFDGKETKEEIITTPHFKILEAIAENGSISISQAKKLVYPDSLQLILFGLRGDGLISEENNIIRISEHLKKLL